MFYGKVEKKKLFLLKIWFKKVFFCAALAQLSQVYTQVLREAAYKKYFRVLQNRVPEDVSTEIVTEIVTV